MAVEFVTGHPKNDLHRRGTYFEVQRRDGDRWTRHAGRRRLGHQYRWRREGLNASVARITWDVPAGTPSGTYRIQHFGNWKNPEGAVFAFTGTSAEFTVR